MRGRSNNALRAANSGGVIARAFTLLEILVVLTVIGVLLGLLMTALSASRQAGLKLRCVSQMQGVAFEFRMFADDFAVRTRGESEQLGPGKFYLDDFQDSMYRIDEFWEGMPVFLDPMQASRNPMMCPAGPSDLSRRPGRTSFEGALWPPKNVSLAFNRRLWRTGLTPGITRLTSRILQYPNVPLLIDIDGDAAVNAGRAPYYIAPPVAGVVDEYAGGGFWFPSYRHKKVNVAFVGGHVASSETPLVEPSWKWGFAPEP